MSSSFNGSDSDASSANVAASTTHKIAGIMIPPDDEQLEPYVRRRRATTDRNRRRLERLTAEDQNRLRTSINSRERRRMHDINDALNDLRSVLPYAQSPNARRWSKINTIIMASNCIRGLNQRLGHVNAENEQLRSLVPSDQLVALKPLLVESPAASLVELSPTPPPHPPPLLQRATRCSPLRSRYTTPTLSSSSASSGSTIAAATTITAATTSIGSTTATTLATIPDVNSKNSTPRSSLPPTLGVESAATDSPPMLPMAFFAAAAAAVFNSASSNIVAPFVAPPPPPPASMLPMSRTLATTSCARRFDSSAVCSCFGCTIAAAAQLQHAAAAAAAMRARHDK